MKEKKGSNFANKAIDALFKVLFSAFLCFPPFQRQWYFERKKSQ